MTLELGVLVGGITSLCVFVGFFGVFTPWFSTRQTVTALVVAATISVWAMAI